MKYLLGAMALLAAVLVAADAGAVGDKDKDKEKPKFTIKEVMKEAHAKGGLLAKVKKGTAEKEDREKLAELYKALVQSTPPKDDPDGVWKKTTTQMHKIAVEAIKDPEAGKKLKVDCGACHKKFKG